MEIGGLRCAALWYRVWPKARYSPDGVLSHSSREERGSTRSTETPRSCPPLLVAHYRTAYGFAPRSQLKAEGAMVDQRPV